VAIEKNKPMNAMHANSSSARLDPCKPSEHFRVLVVDDDPLMREILRCHLTAAGFDCIGAKDGDTALFRMRKEPVSVVLMDIFMPGKDGLETLMEIRRSSPDVPVIIMSGRGEYRGTDLLRFSKKLGANRTLEKPFAGEELVAAVGASLGM
jgi:DNA-binding response OmpR family regulator